MHEKHIEIAYVGYTGVEKYVRSVQGQESVRFCSG